MRSELRRNFKVINDHWLKIRLSNLDENGVDTINPSSILLQDTFQTTVFAYKNTFKPI